MHMQNSAKEILISAPIEVRFAGFRSTTAELAKSGWDLSVRQNQNFYMDQIDFQLAMRYQNQGGGGLYAVSSVSHISREYLYRATKKAHEGDEYAFLELSSQLGIDICVMSPEVRFNCMNVRSFTAKSFLDEWEPFDATPQLQEYDVKNFKFFRTSSPSLKDIIVMPDQIPELMDILLKTQGKRLDEVRKREKSRENQEWYRKGQLLGALPKPSHEIQAQIITLAG